MKSPRLCSVSIPCAAISLIFSAVAVVVAGRRVRVGLVAGGELRCVDNGISDRDLSRDVERFISTTREYVDIPHAVRTVVRFPRLAPVRVHLRYRFVLF